MLTVKIEECQSPYGADRSLSFDEPDAGLVKERIRKLFHLKRRAHKPFKAPARQARIALHDRAAIPQPTLERTISHHRTRLTTPCRSTELQTSTFAGFDVVGSRC